MADILDLKPKTEQQYNKTFDCCDDPIVFTITRNSYYTEKGMKCGVFDHIDSAMCRLKRLLQQNPRDGEKLTIEAHNLRSLEQEEDLDWAHHTHKNA